jgi:hypothetical protein
MSDDARVTWLAEEGTLNRDEEILLAQPLYETSEIEPPPPPEVEVTQLRLDRQLFHALFVFELCCVFGCCAVLLTFWV